MIVSAIIAEYNPFHNGHAYQIQQVRTVTGADVVIVIMSGDFTQRGSCAFIDKYARTHMALSNDVDIVLELPVLGATASAEDFAKIAVSHLNALGVVNNLCFGCENADELPLMMQLSQLLCSEPPAYQNAIKKHTALGLSFPESRVIALCELFPKDADKIRHLLGQPNNILALEYLKALNTCHSDIKPVAVSRKGSGYHDLSLARSMASASGIRHEIITSGTVKNTAATVPPSVMELLDNNFMQRFPMENKDFSSALISAFLPRLSRLTDYIDVSIEIQDRIRNYLMEFTDFDTFASTVKTRQYTQTRIQRCFYHILLDIKNDDRKLYSEFDDCPYIRILGFKKEKAYAFSSMKSHCSAPLITKMAQAQKLLNPKAIPLFLQNIYASDLYRFHTNIKFSTTAKNEFNRGLIISDE